MIRRTTQVTALLLLAVMSVGFSILPGYATGVRAYSSMSIVSSQTTSNAGLKVFTVLVSSQGFNGSSNTLNVAVSQGDQVEITFVYSDPGVDTAHEIAIEGYNVHTAVISNSNPTSKMQFVAGQAGTFLIHCTIPCVGMENLQNAWLVVKQSAGLGIGTSVTLQNPALNGPLLNLVARVTDKAGNPITGLIVNFYVSTDFGMMQIGSNATDTNGVARFTYPLASIRNMTVEAYFPGSGIYQTGNATAALTPSNPGTGFSLFGGETNNPPRGEGAFFDTRLIGVPDQIAAVLATIVLIVILCVWSTFAYVVSLVLKIRRYNSKKEGR